MYIFLFVQKFSILLVWLFCIPLFPHGHWFSRISEYQVSAFIKTSLFLFKYKFFPVCTVCTGEINYVCCLSSQCRYDIFLLLFTYVLIYYNLYSFVIIVDNLSAYLHRFFTPYSSIFLLSISFTFWFKEKFIYTRNYHLTDIFAKLRSTDFSV